MSEISLTEYRQEVESLAKQITEEAAEYDRDLYDVLHETIDGHQWLLYTAYAFDVLRHSEHDDYAVREWGTESIVDDSGIRWSALVFGALYADVMDHIHESADNG